MMLIFQNIPADLSAQIFAGANFSEYTRQPFNFRPGGYIFSRDYPLQSHTSFWAGDFLPSAPGLEFCDFIKYNFWIFVIFLLYLAGIL